MKEGVRGMRRASSVKEETRASLQLVVMGVKTLSVIPLLHSQLSAGGGASLVIAVAPTRERGKAVVVLARFSIGVRTPERVCRTAGSFTTCVGVVGVVGGRFIDGRVRVSRFFNQAVRVALDLFSDKGRARAISLRLFLQSSVI